MEQTKILTFHQNRTNNNETLIQTINETKRQNQRKPNEKHNITNEIVKKR